MKKPIIVLALLMISFKSFAQVKSPLLNCVDPLKNNFQFTVIFNGQNATVVLKGWTYNLKYNRAWVSSRGERWSEYKNQEIIVGTTFPFDKYVDLSTGGWSPRPIASAHCN